MLNNFCFHVYAQKSLFIGENDNVYFWTAAAPGLSVYPETETETRVTVLSISDGFLIMTRFWPRIVLLPRYRILLAHLNLYYLCALYYIKVG